MIKAHILDIGKQRYGDSILLQIGERVILIDGGNPSSYRSSELHDSIPIQLGKILGGEAPYEISLLVVTHAHNDHIGCLPNLVKDKVISVEWALVADPDLGWGNVVDGGAIDQDASPEVQTMMAAFREELRFDLTDDELSEFLGDVQTLRTKYREMIETLESDGVNVIKYVGGNEVNNLVEEFDDIGLKILGPSQYMLLRCAQRIQSLGRDFMDTAADAMALDNEIDELQVYRRLAGAPSDAMDSSGIGAALNCMSTVLMFEMEEVKLLFTGDMQFTDSGVPDAPETEEEFRFETLMNNLRLEISNLAPFDLYKIGHHGSSNSIDQSVIDELGGTINFCISTGRKSERHPSVSVLELLKENIDDIFWVRTDKNGCCSFDFSDDPRSIEIDRGIFTDWRRNHVDSNNKPSIAIPKTTMPVGQVPVRVSEQHAPVKPVSQRLGSSRDNVEVITRVPHRQTRVTVTIEVDPGDDKEAEHLPQMARSPHLPDSQLLFVTDSVRLGRALGVNQFEEILSSITTSGNRLVDVTGHNDESAVVARRIKAQLGAGNVKGVVIVGGYDIVPSAVIDVLPESLRNKVGNTNGDPDNFIVWSDDLYGDVDGDDVAELPVSRIPDGGSAKLVRNALASKPPLNSKTRQGLRNVQRPFADGVFDILSGNGGMLKSQPTIHTEVPELSHDYVYLMLHGSYADQTEFHGEQTAGGVPAMRLENVPEVARAVVFTGCCWGALIVDKPAVRAASEVAKSRTSKDSIAMKFLASGARAFVGCTGVHYSPIQSPYDSFGGPMHESFWRHIVAGQPPAKALFEAKKEYALGMFHGRTDAIEQAIEYKILRQFTCLGLGW